MAGVLRDLLQNLTLASELAPEKERLAIRRACPVPGCGIADKHGIRNEVEFREDRTIITFRCPDHGPHTATLENPEEAVELEMNTPLRNLVRTILYSEDTRRSSLNPECQRTRHHLKVTGSDYAGLYQEQLLWRQLARIPGTTPPVIIYAPLIIDWAGSKLSKSLYVKNDAYQYMELLSMTRFLSYAEAKKVGTDWTPLFTDIEKWLEHPQKLFGAKSVDYMRLLIDGALSSTESSTLSPPRPTYPIRPEGHGTQEDNHFVVYHDGEIHDPLGAGSYVFEKQLASALLRYLGILRSHEFKKATLSIHPPNVVNAMLSILSLVLWHKLQQTKSELCPDLELKPIIELDLAHPSNPANDHLLKKHLVLVQSVFAALGVEVELRINRIEDLSHSPAFCSVLRRILADEDRIVAELVPEDRSLGIGCPYSMGACDFYGELTTNALGCGGKHPSVNFGCPKHSTYPSILDREGEAGRLHVAKPVLDLIRTLLYAEDTIQSRREVAANPEASARFHMRIAGTGSGFFNEQLLFRQLFFVASDEVKQSAFPVIFYAPSIIDWSGARLSKTAFADGAYEFMKEREMDYLLSYPMLKKKGIYLTPLVEEVKEWVRQPKKLFRSYTVEYLHRIFSTANSTKA